VQFQSGSGRGELIYISHTHNRLVRDEVKKGSRVIRLPMPGRKHSLNRLPYYTFIGDDSTDCLKDMFQKQGYKEKPCLFVDQYDRPLSGASLQMYFTAHAMRVGLIKPASPPCEKCASPTNRVRSYKMDKQRHVVYVCVSCGHVQPSPYKPKNIGGIRYRVKTHELRDLFKTECHRSLQSGNNFDLSVADFCMGHSIDSNKYDKIMKDRAYTLAEYRKVLPFLNVLSENPRVVERGELDVEREALRRELAELKRDVGRLRQFENTFADPDFQALMREWLKKH